MFKQLITNNLPAKVASVLLAVLLWAVIKQSQLAAPTSAQQKPAEQNVSFGARAYGK